MGECIWGVSGVESRHGPTLVPGPRTRLTRQLVWLFSAATERDPEMMNCVGERGLLWGFGQDTEQDTHAWFCQGRGHLLAATSSAWRSGALVPLWLLRAPVQGTS